MLQRDGAERVIALVVSSNLGEAAVNDAHTTVSLKHSILFGSLVQLVKAVLCGWHKALLTVAIVILLLFLGWIVFFFTFWLGFKLTL